MILFHDITDYDVYLSVACHMGSSNRWNLDVLSGVYIRVAIK